MWSSSEQSTTDQLRSTLYETIPFCSGTLEVSPRDLVLYYGKGRDATRIDLSQTTSEELDRLDQGSEPMTFGLGEQEHRNQFYRQAGKLDADSFMLGFEPERVGLVDAVRAVLLPRDDQLDHVDVELHQLEVYGPGTSLKPHQCEPYAGNMFGSLVVVLPTPHEGGCLQLRHEQSGWSIDTGQILSDLSSAPRIAFVAFFSDVEYEVTPVVSGYRITLVYNFHFPATPTRGVAPSPPSGLHIIQPAGASAYEVTSALFLFLEDWTILPKGGLLGFGLRHKYPLPKSWAIGDPNPLLMLQQWLKGSDAALWKACKSHGLQPAVRVAVLDDMFGKTIGPVLLDKFCEMDRYECESSNLPDVLWETHGGRLMLCEPLAREPTNAEIGYISTASNHDDDELDREQKATVHLVTPITKFNRVKTAHVRYANSPPTLGLMYQYVFLTVEIGPAGQRREPPTEGAEDADELSGDERDSDVDIE